VSGAATLCTYCDELFQVMHCVLSLHPYHPAHRDTFYLLVAVVARLITATRASCIRGTSALPAR